MANVRLKMVPAGESATPETESNLKWAARNIAQAPGRSITNLASFAGYPTDVARALKSDLGISDQPPLYPKKEDQEPPSLSDRYMMSLMKDAGIDVTPLPEAEEELTRGFPGSQEIREAVEPWNLFGASREGDWLSGGLAHILPFVANQGAPTIANLLQSGLMAAGSYLGSKGGSSAGEVVGKEIGLPKTLELLGGLGGSMLGIKGAKTAYAYGKNIPTRTIPEKVEAKITKQREVLARKRAEIPEKIQEYQKIATENYNQLENLLNKKYKGDIQLKVPSLSKNLQKLADKSTRGIAELHQGQVYKLFQNILDDINDGKMSLDVARSTVENLGRTAYEGGLSPAVKHAASRARDIIKNSVTESLDQYPDVKKYWESADTSYRQYKDLVKRQPKIEREITAAEKKLEPKEAQMHPIERTIRVLSGRFAPRALGYTLAGQVARMLGIPGANLISLSGAVGTEIGRQLKTLRGVMREHPEIYKEWKSAIKEAKRGKPSDLVGLIPRVEELMPESKKRKLKLVSID